MEANKLHFIQYKHIYKNNYMCLQLERIKIYKKFPRLGRQMRMRLREGDGYQVPTQSFGEAKYLRVRLERSQVESP